MTSSSRRRRASWLTTGDAVDHHRDHGDVAVLVLDGVHRHHREGAHQVVEHLVLRRQVDGEVVPLLGRDLGQAALHHRLVGRDDLHDRASAVREVLPDRGHEGGGLQAGQQVAEEPLLAAFERRHDGRGGQAGLGLAVLGHANRLQRGAQVLVDQLVGVGPGVPDGDVVLRERMTQGLVFDAVERQRAGDVEAHGLQLARDQLHHRHAAGLDRVHEGVAGGEGRFRPAPEAQPRGIGQVLRRRGAGRRDVEDPGAGQAVLQGQPGHALLRGLLGPARALAAAGGVGHGVGLVEDDHPVEVRPQPVDDLVQARAPVAPGRLAQGGVGRDRGCPDPCGWRRPVSTPIAG